MNLPAPLIRNISSEITLCKIAKLLPNTDIQLPNDKSFLLSGELWEKLFDCDIEKIIEVIKENKRTLCLHRTNENENNCCYLAIAHSSQYKKSRNRNAINWLYSEIFSNYDMKLERNNLTASKDETFATISNLTKKLFNDLKNAHGQPNSITSVPHQQFTLPVQFQPILREYQEKTIKWLYHRETSKDILCHFYHELNARDKETKVYINFLYPLFRSILNTPYNIDIPLGGILAEEMGLGKTVEMIAVILLNRRPMPMPMPTYNETNNIPLKKIKTEIDYEEIFCICSSKNSNNLIQCTKCNLWQHFECVCLYNECNSDDVNNPYWCPQCWEKETDLIISGGTFIVSPNSIKLQWVSEMEKHISPPLRVLLYEGVSKSKWISPRQLASYDIILTDYNILNKELYFISENRLSVDLRKKPKFMRVNSPVLMVEWWRVCLDEAQMVESDSARATKMVRRLPAIIRWAVTGTPIQQSIDDIKSLLEFIGFDLFIECSEIWNELVGRFIQNEENSFQHNHIRLIGILQKCMWRTCKTDVIEQLKIPSQNEIVHYVQLNDCEMLFYRDQHTVCEASFNTQITKYCLEMDTSSTRITQISQEILKNVFKPFLRIRQCCTIPVVVGAKLHTKDNKNKKTQKTTTVKFLQPKELHKHLKSATEHDCKSQLRTMASSYNGLAAIYFIQKNYSEAIRHYEFVLKLARDYTGNICVDTLLQIHALHNISQAHNSLPQNLQQETMIKDYEILCGTLQKKYLETYITNLLSSQANYKKALDTRQMSGEKSEYTLEEFAEIILNEMIIKSSDAEFHLISKLSDELKDYKIQDSLHSSSTILYTIHIWYDRLVEIQKAIAVKLRKMQFLISAVQSSNPVQQNHKRDKFIQTVYNCHLSEIHDKNDKKSKKEKEGNLCQLCTLKDDISEYECLVFDKTLDKTTNQAAGLANPSKQLTLLKALIQYAKAKLLHREYEFEFKLHLDIINYLKIEYKELIKFWIEIEYTVKAYDELNMCKMRISLVECDEEKTTFNVYQDEIDGTLIEQKHVLQQAQYEFTLKLARLKYVNHLEKKPDPGSCPVCQSNGHTQYAVLQCGHHICLYCLNKMMKCSKLQNITCAICRNKQLLRDVYYVTQNKSTDDDSETMHGDYSSKIQSIVRQVLKLKNLTEDKNNSPKIIIFSQWEPILRTISDALTKNEIEHKVKWAPESIKQFKDPESNITCLLMLLSHGSKGLNLVEATHVFLVEPIINHSEELQAIGRVHRIGQTKPTTVHRFIVKNTIEENIYDTMIRKKECSSDSITIDSIKKLFHLNAIDFPEIREC